jgi:hypothetical protein
MNTPGVLLSLSLLTSFSSLMFARQPNVRRCPTAGVHPCQASYGVFPSRLLVGYRLSKCTAVIIASPQNFVGMPLCLSRAGAVATTVWYGTE